MIAPLCDKSVLALVLCPAAAVYDITFSKVWFAFCFLGLSCTWELGLLSVSVSQHICLLLSLSPHRFSVLQPSSSKWNFCCSFSRHNKICHYWRFYLDWSSYTQCVCMVYVCMHACVLVYTFSWRTNLWYCNLNSSNRTNIPRKRTYDSVHFRIACFKLQNELACFNLSA